MATSEEVEQLIKANQEELDEIGRSIAALYEAFPTILGPQRPPNQINPEALLDGLWEAIFDTLRMRYMNPNLRTILRASSEVAEEIVRHRIERMLGE